MKKQIAAPVLVIAGASCWGLIGLFTRPLMAAGCSAADIAFLRVAFSAALLWMFLAVFCPGLLKVKIKDLWMFLGTGVISLVFFSVMYFRTQQEASLSVAAVLLYTSPFFVMILSAVLFREKITGRMIISLVLAVFGCVCATGLLESLVSGSEVVLSPLGILTGIGSGLGYALYSIFANIALKKYKSVTVTAYTFLFAALALAPFQGRGELFIKFMGQGSILPQVLALAVISTILPYALYTMGLKYTTPGRASVMAFAEPLVAAIMGAAVFKEELTTGSISGIMLIFISIVLLNTHRSKEAK